MGGEDEQADARSSVVYEERDEGEWGGGTVAAPLLQGDREGDRDGDEELDFNEEFADDEETPFIEGNEEDNRELEERIKREIREADKYMSERVYDEKRKINKEGRKIRKYLTCHEKNHIYETDEEDNPYVSEEDIDSDRSIFQKEEEIIIKQRLARDKKKQPSDCHANKEPSPASVELSTEVSNHLSAYFTKHLALSNALKAQKQEYLRSIRSTRPYLITLKLQKHHLMAYASAFEPFIPTSSPSLSKNTSLECHKRRKLDIDTDSSGEPSTFGSNDSKKIKIKVTNHSQNHNLNIFSTSDSETNNVADTPSNDSYLVTEEELRNAIQSKKMNAKELLKSFKPKLGMNPKNRDLILELVTRIAKMENGYLVLKN
ncbi:hypothetical protein PORY_000603 [Pneumocystis oryctolagi]|uniref:Uncharacterized protein n=1 Tax=Pneumocystis oryctolagi TaxID=42067 RepID=A0ACB7CFH3_9ASCO|nr:hypothetical protein PORY_000603 [Pneumocystis oryctolagi]